MSWKEWIVIILGSFLLVGFVFWAESRPKLEEGTVISKEFEPAHTTRTTVSIPHRVGKITTVSVVPVTRHYDDQWTITFEGYVNGELKVRTAYVTEEVYNSYEIGDHFIYDKERDSDEESYVEERDE